MTLARDLTRDCRRWLGVVCALSITVCGSAEAQVLPRNLFAFPPLPKPESALISDPGRRADPIDHDRRTQLFVWPTDQDPAQDPAQVPPPQQHTGFQALLRTTGADFAAFPKRRSTWVILAVGAGAAAAAHPADDNVNARLTGNRTMTRVFAPGKYIGLGYVQAGAAIGTYLVGRYLLPAETKDGRRTNKVSHLGFDLLRANILAQSFTYGIKLAVRRDRPSGACCSFPSGHASTTFATAAVLERHFGLRGAWPTIFIASYVAASRLHDNRHFVSDVIFGAALGTAAGWTVVGRHGRSEYALIPVPTRGGFAIALVRQARLSSTDREGDRR